MEKTAEYTALADFIEEHMPLRWMRYQREAALADIFDMLRVDVDLNAFVRLLDAMGIEFIDEDDVEHFTKLWMNYVNNARLFSNRGYTPRELLAMRPNRYEQPQTASIGPRMRVVT